jgi:phage-related protein
MKDDITNTFLGISSVSDAVSSVVGDMINALREGEDAMDVFGNSIDDMVANMIKQVFSARIVGPMLEKVWENIDAEIQKRGESFADYYADYQTTLDHINTTTGGTGDGYYFWKNTNGSLEYSNSLWKWQKAMMDGAENLTYQQWQETLQAWADWAKKNLQDATTPTMNDVRRFGTDLQGISPELEGYIGELENILREMGLIKDQTKADALSKLQQGIEGVTEDTAGAIEAYMNIVAQRVFEQNEYLMQIRDIVVGFNLDVQVATIGQMLYQMQQSYQVQQAIQARLDGWSNANGMAVRVEMV